jgi:hypothetical protein
VSIAVSANARDSDSFVSLGDRTTRYGSFGAGQRLLTTSQGEEVLYLPTIVDAAESSPTAAKEAAHVIRKFLGKDHFQRAYVQYNAIMLMRILADNPGKTFTRNLDAKFTATTKDLLRDGRDMSVQQILRETLDAFQLHKAQDETLAPLIKMWQTEKAKFGGQNGTYAVWPNFAKEFAVYLLIIGVAGTADPECASFQPAATELLLPSAFPAWTSPSPRACFPHRRSQDLRQASLTSRTIHTAQRSRRQRIVERIRRALCLGLTLDTGLHQRGRPGSRRRNDADAYRNKRAALRRPLKAPARSPQCPQSNRHLTQPHPAAAGPTPAQRRASSRIYPSYRPSATYRRPRGASATSRNATAP